MLSRAYYAAQLGRSGRGVVRQLARPPAAAAGHVAQARRDTTSARAAATAALAGEQLDAAATAAVGKRQEAATRVTKRRDSDRREVRALDRHLAGHDEERAAARAQGLPEPAANEQQAAMQARRRELQERLADPAVRAAEQTRLRAKRATAETGDPVPSQDVRAYRERRGRELQQDLPADDPRHLRAAGIDPADYARADNAERSRLRERAAEAIRRERALQAAAEGRPAEVRIDPRELRRRTATERERIRREREQRRTRANVFRGR